MLFVGPITVEHFAFGIPLLKLVSSSNTLIFEMKYNEKLDMSSLSKNTVFRFEDHSYELFQLAKASFALYPP